MENGKQGAFACPDNGTEYTTTWQGQVGLTKREYFAGLAMQGMLSLPKNYGDKQIMINVAIEYADELLKQLESE